MFEVRAHIDFVLKDRLGKEGQNSEVYKAHDPQLDAEIAVKKIKLSTIDPEEYFNESKILYKTRHKNVVEIKYACKDEENLFIAMPLYPKGSLKYLVDQRFLTVREIIKYSIDILTGLHHIHSKKLIHFDIKPDNILIADNEDAIISDFGIAKYTNYDGIAGQDRQYIKIKPPEAFDYGYFDLKYDLYQFGLLLYRMCNGNTDFYSQFNKFLVNGELDRPSFKFACKNGKFPDRNSFLYYIPTKLRTIIKTCLEPDPDKRYSSALEISNQLGSIDGPLLDWEYSQISDTIILKKKLDDKTIKMIIDKDLNAISTKTFANGNIQKINSHCKKSISPKEVKEFIEKY